MTCCPDKRTVNKGVHLVIVPDRVGQSGSILKSLLFSKLSPYLQIRSRFLNRPWPRLTGSSGLLKSAEIRARWRQPWVSPIKAAQLLT
jgi:hypothetical protein